MARYVFSYDLNNESNYESAQKQVMSKLEEYKKNGLLSIQKIASTTFILTFKKSKNVDWYGKNLEKVFDEDDVFFFGKLGKYGKKKAGFCWELTYSPKEKDLSR